MNSAGIVETDARTYIVAVYTEGNASLAEGQAILRDVCASIAAALA